MVVQTKHQYSMPEGPSLTCDILLDLMHLADGIIIAEHVQVEGSWVFAHPGPGANIWGGPTACLNVIVSLSKVQQSC